MLRDSDARIRNEAANALFDHYCTQFIDASCKKSSISEFAAEILSNEVPFSLNSPMEPLSGFHLGINSPTYDSQQIKRVLGKYLFDLANMLFALKSSEQLVSNQLIYHFIKHISISAKSDAIFSLILAWYNKMFTQYDECIPSDSIC